jgi:hypothetical protein
VELLVTAAVAGVFSGLRLRAAPRGLPTAEAAATSAAM